MNQNQEEAKATEKKEIEGLPIFKLLSLVLDGEDVTVRDDQYDFLWLPEAIKRCRKRGFRFRLIDSGHFDFSQLGWLVQAGADLYTSEEVRPQNTELQFLSKTAQKGRAIVAYFLRSRTEEESDKEAQDSTLADAVNLAASGAYLYISSKKAKLNLSQLSQLARASHLAGSWLVYYHHGPLESDLDRLAASGAWIHLSNKSLQEEDEFPLLLSIIKSARYSGANLIFHLERGVDGNLVMDVVKEGAFVLFDSFLPDFKSPLYSIAKQVRRKKLDFRSYYLYPHFLL